MTHRALRTVFAGTPAFAATQLQGLLNAELEVIAVLTQPDRPAGRGKQLQPSAVKILAEANHIKVLQPETLRSAEQVSMLKALAPDVLVVAAYGLLLPVDILTIPVFGCINVHASLLPRWRGAAPIEHAILEGDEESGITIMQMDEGLDTGDILLALPTPVFATDNSATLTERLATLGCRGLLQVLTAIGEDTVTAVPQDEAVSTYAPKLSKAEALICWNRPAIEIQRQVNAFFPRSPAYCFFKGERIRIICASATAASQHEAPGTLVQADTEGLLISCRDSCLRVTDVQLPGKTAVPVAALLNSRSSHFSPGSVFSAHDGSPA